MYPTVVAVIYICPIIVYVFISRFGLCHDASFEDIDLSYNYNLVLSCCLKGPYPLLEEIDSQSGRTALIMAAMNGHTICVRLLIDAGADMDAKDMVCRGSLLC